MVTTPVYVFEDYRQLITDRLQQIGGRGQRQRLAEYLGCQVSFLSQVLTGDKHFSLEQIEKISRYLSLSQDEEDYLFDLLSFNRAGTAALQEKYRRRLDKMRRAQKDLKKILKEQTELNSKKQAVYYSHWAYAAVHMAVTIPSLQSVQALEKALRLDREKLLSVLKFLSDIGYVEMHDGQVKPLNAQVYVGKGSPHSLRHHANVRTKILADLAFEKPEELSYSLFFTASKSDLPLVREVLAGAIEKCLKVIRPSPAETLGMISIDLKLP
jgi:uncharacterized protein (TIGR02147 family)